MNLSSVLAQLRKELEHLDAAILSLERLQRKLLRRGRSPRVPGRPNRERTQARPSVAKRRLKGSAD